MPTVDSINLSPGGIPKRPVESIEVSDAGLLGDGHDHEKHRTPLQAVSLLDVELLDALRAESGIPLTAGSLGENLTLRGVGVQRLGAGDRLHLGGDDGVILEVTRVRPPCYVLDVLSPDFKRVLWNRIGMYASVIRRGQVTTGEPIRIELRAAEIRPLVREPKGGCIDGSSIARSVLADQGLLPVIADPEGRDSLAAETPKTEPRT